MLIEYDKSPGISPEQRIRSLADSVRRAFEEIEKGVVVANNDNNNKITLEELGGYPKTGGAIEGNLSVLGNSATLFGEATEEGFIVEGYKPAKFTGNMFMAIDEETQSLCQQTLGADILDYMYPNGEIPEIATDEGIKYLIDCIYYVGKVITADSADFNPNTAYPWQTWERFAKGRTLVGVDEDDEDFASAGLELGEKNHKLIVAEMPSHSHSFTVRATSGTAAAWRLDYQNVQGQTASTNNTGGDQPHNNIQPSITVYFWRRTG